MVPPTESLHALSLTSEEAQILSSWMEAPETPKSVALRATIIRELARGRSNSEIARKLSVSRGTVIRWRRRFESEGVLSLSEVKPGRGRRPSVTAGVVEAILASAGHEPSLRSAAEQAGVSAATVYRVWDRHGVVRKNQASRKAVAAEGELVVLTGIFLDPPDRMVVLRVPPSAGFESARPGLPKSFARTLDRFDRAVVGDCLPRDRERALLKFLRKVESAPKGARVVLLVDAAGSTHRRTGVRRWLASRSGLDVRLVRGADSTAAMLGRSLPDPESSVALRRLIEDVEGYLLSYRGEPDRFVWPA